MKKGHIGFNCEYCSYSSKYKANVLRHVKSKVASSFKLVFCLHHKSKLSTRPWRPESALVSHQNQNLWSNNSHWKEGSLAPGSQPRLLLQRPIVSSVPLCIHNDKKNPTDHTIRHSARLAPESPSSVGLAQQSFIL